MGVLKMKPISSAITRFLILIVVLVLPACAGKTLDHFRFYKAEQVGSELPLGDRMQLLGQLDLTGAAPIFFKIHNLDYFGPPVIKNGENNNQYYDPNDHLAWYDFENPEAEKPAWKVFVKNQYTNEEVIALELNNMPAAVLVPTWKKKGKLQLPKNLSHYKLYRIITQVSVEKPVNLTDQFLSNDQTVMLAVYFGVPVRKKVQGKPKWENIKSEQHLTIYTLNEVEVPDPEEFKIKNQFEDNRSYKATVTKFLAVPTEKIGDPKRIDIPQPPND